VIKTRKRIGRNLVKIVAVCCLTALQIVNVLTANVDGMIMGAVIAAVAGLAGYELKGR